MPLFSDLERTDSTPAAYGEAMYSFFDRVASPYFANVRDLLERWYANLPPEMHLDIRRRFQSRHQAETVAAFWEMYLHEALTRAGFRLISHPDVPGTKKHPDFLVTAPDSKSFYLEATTVGPLDDAAERRFDRVLDALNRIKSNNFFLEVSANLIGPRAFPARQKSHELSRWLDSLDPDDVKAAYEGGGILGLPPFVWKQDGWEVEFRPIPIKPEVRGNPAHRIVGMLSYDYGAIVNDRPAIQSSLEAKAKRYGQLDRPLVVALLAYDRVAIDSDDFEAALYGATGLHGRPSPRGADPGLWQTAAGPRYRRVSAVLLSQHLAMWQVATEVPRLWHNPWAYKPLDVQLPWPSIRLDSGTGRLIEQDGGMPPHVLFGLPADWPGPELWGNS